MGLANTYFIAAIMDQHFNPVTMSLPTHYLMKEGYFSSGTKFEQIFSIYGRQNISVTFKNLSQGQKLSVFYFVTVDNSALNSRNSKVLYQDLVTSTNQIIDLSEWAIRIGLILCALVFLLWFFIILNSIILINCKHEYDHNQTSLMNLSMLMKSLIIIYSTSFMSALVRNS